MADGKMTIINLKNKLKNLKKTYVEFNLEDIEGIDEYDFVIPKDNNTNDLEKSLLYFLVYKDEIVYIGQTNVLPSIRLTKHSKNLLFDNFIIVPLDSDERELVNEHEQYFIKLCNPILNGILTTFEGSNTNGVKTADEIMTWYNQSDNLNNKRPGRPFLYKEERTNINFRLPDNTKDKFNIAASYYGGKTKYLQRLITLDIENNYDRYLEDYKFKNA